MIPLRKETPRLVIRPYAEGDFAAWVGANETMAPVVERFDLPARPADQLTPAFYARMLEAQAATRERGELFDLGVFRRDDGALLGGVSLMDVKRVVVFNANLGYRFFNQHWGKGYAREAVEGAIDLAFGPLELHRVEAAIEPENFRSIRLAEKVGLRLEGFKRRFLSLCGSWRDCLVYAMTSEEKGIAHPGREPSDAPNLRW